MNSGMMDHIVGACCRRSLWIRKHVLHGLWNEHGGTEHPSLSGRKRVRSLFRDQVRSEWPKRESLVPLVFQFDHSYRHQLLPAGILRRVVRSSQTAFRLTRAHVHQPRPAGCWSRSRPLPKVSTFRHMHLNPKLSTFEQ